LAFLSDWFGGIHRSDGIAQADFRELPVFDLGPCCARPGCGGNVFIDHGDWETIAGCNYALGPLAKFWEGY